MFVKEIMTKKVTLARPGESLVEAAKQMKRKDYGSLLVSENDRLVGVITDRDIVLRAVSKGKDLATATVKEVMTPKVLYCYEDETVEKAAANMAQNKIHRLPVLNKQKRLVGVISLGDISSCATGPAGKALHDICQKK